MKRRISRAALALLALASATTLLALPQEVSAAQKSAPATQASIMGTPAQLAEDLKIAGFDLANMRVAKPELLNKALKTTSETRDEWTVSNAVLYTDHESGQLECISFYYYRAARTAPDEKAALYPMSALAPGLTGGTDAVIKRYGKPHRSLTTVGGVSSCTYYILISCKSPLLWRCSFGFDDEGHTWFAARTMGKNFKELKVRRNGSSLSFQGARSALYGDLAQMGFAPGMHSTRPDVLAHGKADTNFPDSLSYRYRNGSISLDSSRRVRSFIYSESEGYGLTWFIFNVLDRLFEHLYTWPKGVFSETLRAGEEAVISRYGQPDELGSGPEDIRYYILVEDGDKLIPIRLDFTFDNYDDWSTFWASGRVITDKLYVLEPVKPK